MHRIGKLLGMIFILGIVFFIICDEKGIKIGFENNHIIFSQTGENSDSSIKRQSGTKMDNNDYDTDSSDLIQTGIAFSSLTSSNSNAEKVEIYPGMLKSQDIQKYVIMPHTINLKKASKAEQRNYDKDDDSESDNLFSELLENEEIDVETLQTRDEEFLQKVFEKTKDPQIINLILKNYITEYQFVKAKKFIENLSPEYREMVDPLMDLQISFNSFPLSSNTIYYSLKNLIDDYKDNNRILNEDVSRYLGIIYLMQKNYDEFFNVAMDFSVQPHKDFASKIQGYRDQIKTQMGMPEYYLDALVALGLFNQGFFQPAKILALSVLTQDSQYILPYQVLAYSNFLTNSRESSIEYLQKLMDLDPTNAEKYRFLLGAAYYRDKKYEQSVVMLSLVTDEKLRLDTERYLIRDYLILDQKNKLIANRSKLLGYKDLVASDFYTYFYETFYRPYSKGEEFEIYAYDTNLADKMLRVCKLLLAEGDKAVCTYGSIGKSIALGNFDGLEGALLNIASEYPQGYLYQALGDYYIQEGDLDKARTYLLKAVSLTQQKSEINQIKKLLQDTM